MADENRQAEIRTSHPVRTDGAELSLVPESSNFVDKRREGLDE